VSQIIPGDDKPVVTTWPISSFELSGENPSATSWFGFDNYEPLVLRKGAIFEFDFNPDELNSPGMSRDYVIKAVGRYQPDYSVYTHLMPGQVQLYNNYPNPFNPTTTINYDLSAATHVKLAIYNILGQNVKTLVDCYEDSGHKTVIWDGTDSFGRQVASGMYFYRLEAGDFSDSRKMVLMK
jgi:hypothetical protein